MSNTQHKKILIIEDEPDIQEMLSFNLENEGYQVNSFDSGEKGLEMIAKNPPDLILLDLMLPGIDGLEVCRRIRKHPEYNSICIVMLTAKGEEPDIVSGLELGADDYITKPFSPKVLLARIKGVMRRNRLPSQDDQILNISGLAVIPHRREVIYNNRSIELTESEFKALYFLAKRPGWVFTRYQMIDAIHGQGHPTTDRAIDVLIVSLRKKMGDAAHLIDTVRGVGYKFKEES